MPFDSSRRLTGSNLFFDSPGAVLETLGITVDDALLAGWRDRVVRARAVLGWPTSANSVVARRHAAGASLALAAPFDKLYTATEVNEWALCATLVERDPARWSHLENALVEAACQAGRDAAESPTATSLPHMAVEFLTDLPVIEERAALDRFMELSRAETPPLLQALVAAAESRALVHVLDDDYLTFGSGINGETWSVDRLPQVERVPWDALSAVPTAIVTGSNGKTTTVRLLAACARAHGWRDGYNCTDGVFVAGKQIESGDYSGPVGTRTVLRDERVEAAILETARGGILRRGLACDRARVAVVTNVSADHFGEYGIDDLAGLADVKLVVARTLGEAGLLVLNADDPVLRERAMKLNCRIAWFSRTYGNDGAACGVRDGRLIVKHGAEEIDLGAITTMPLTVDGYAEYNISNIAGVALAALALGIAPDTIRDVLARFGRDPADNPGRLMRYDYRGAQVLIDYAHNPDGLRGLMNVATRLPRAGRLALLLGQAGNRANADIEQLAAAAASFRPDFVLIKETEAYLRGRAPGEVPAILRAALVREGMQDAALEVAPNELAAVKRALEWSQPGDVLVLPVHDRAVRAETVALVHPASRSPDMQP